MPSSQPLTLARTALLALLGVAVLRVSWADLAEALRLAPVERPCGAWLAAPTEARWVALTGCRLDLQTASRRNARWAPRPDGGRGPGPTLELFLPVAAGEEREVPIRGVVAIDDPKLLALVDELAAQPVEGVDAFVERHRDELEAWLKPARLVGYVEPLASVWTRAGLKALEAPGAAVLVAGREPERVNALVGLVVALGLLASAVWGPVSRLLGRGPKALDD